MNILFVAYEIHAKVAEKQLFFSDQSIQRQQKNIHEFMTSQTNGELIKTFIEFQTQGRQKNLWPQLKAAVDFCLAHQANLVVAEIRNLTQNECFTEQILKLLKTPHLQIFCCDQPLINSQNFLAFVEHARKQKELHGQLIKAGLSRSLAKSGNPHAVETISKVNKPKIDNAILFALLLQPIISSYLARGLTQRQMVQALNEEGFTAPEGGTWVLSQLQKILERVRVNEAAMTLEKQLLEYRSREIPATEIVEKLNNLGVPPPKGTVWDLTQLEIVSERIKQIHDIIRFNEFVIELMPILEQYHTDEITQAVLEHEMHVAGIVFPENMVLVK